MLGKIYGTRNRGRFRTRWMVNIKEAAGMKIRDTKEMAKDRDLWHRLWESPGTACDSMELNDDD